MDNLVWATYQDYLRCQPPGLLERVRLRLSGRCTKCRGTGRVAVIWDPGLYIWVRCVKCRAEEGSGP